MVREGVCIHLLVAVVVFCCLAIASYFSNSVKLLQSSCYDSNLIKQVDRFLQLLIKSHWYSPLHILRGFLCLWSVWGGRREGCWYLFVD